MSKSLGNVVAPQDLIQKYGADIVRLWVASLDYRDDDPISEEILARCGEAYRKIRNTARYLLSNLYDFDPAADAVPAERLLPLDRWALAQARAVVRRVHAAYETYEFHVVYHQLVNFCATTLSAFYCDILKDRLYASAADSRRAPLRADGHPPHHPGPGHGGGAPASLHGRGDLEGAARERRKNRSTWRVSTAWTTCR